MARDSRFFLKPHYSNSRALLIGIDKSQNASPLSYAVSDAQGMHDVLINDFSFPSENVTVLIDEAATRHNILSAYLRFADSKSDLDDRIIVFFAGHGLTRTGMRGEVGFLVPSDGNSAELSTLIRWDELTKNAELIRAKHLLFIMDACYGGLALTRTLAPGSARFLKDMMLRYSRQVLTAGKADEEVADSGGPLPNHSVFTGHLIEGLRGKAHSQDGILTANALMSYVYGKVANDNNSSQTPHYGYFDGDGDFILDAPQLKALEEVEEQDLDILLSVPFAEEEPAAETTEQKIKTIKLLLAADGSSIELHDFVVSEIRRFLSGINDDHFKTQGQFSQRELIERITRYETLTNDLSLLAACIAHWAKPGHQMILQKIISRSTDHLEPQNGVIAWLSLRWYPLIIELYCSGIAAVAGGRFDSLTHIFYSPIALNANNQSGDHAFAQSVAQGILDLAQNEVFKRLPGYERQHTPMSDYLFKILQPRLDDALFLGKGYEKAFDDFEALFALAVFDLRKQSGDHPYAPIGRFGWKGRRTNDRPLSRLIAYARSMGERWEPLQAGLFGGEAKRFDTAATDFEANVNKLNWF